MAVGDQTNILGRLKSLLPFGWFPQGQTPVLDTALSGAAAALAWAYNLLTWTGQQMRLATSQGGMLDLFAYDYFGSNLPRLPNESDTAYAARIKAALLAPADTRGALINMLTALTGTPPLVFEPGHQADTGGIGTGYLGWTSGPGGWGSLALPYQLFVVAYRPISPPVGAAQRQGWGNIAAGISFAIGGWGKLLMGYTSPSAAAGLVTDAMIYRQIAAIMPAGVIAWVYITNKPSE